MNWERHFRDMNRKSRVRVEPTKYSKEYSVGFGADSPSGYVERGIMPPGVTDSRVMPPGRYWLDVFGDKVKVFTDWLAQHHEVRLEVSEQDTDGSHLFAIIDIPPNASNYGMSGVIFPTNALGFLTVAEPFIKSIADTVQRPDAPTPTDVAQNIADSIGKVVGTGSKAVVQSAGGIFDNVSTATMVKVGLAVGVVILIATIPSAVLKHAATKAL